MRARHRLPGVLALGVAGLMALSGAVGTGSALAAEEPGEHCVDSAELVGQGSSLQKVAQGIWGEEKEVGKGFQLSTNGSACSGSTLKIKYESTGSGAGRTVWGAEKTGHTPLDGTKETPSEAGDGFVASDEPLSPEQMENIDLAAGLVVGEAGQTIVIPVEQAAVAVIVNPPAECLITKITNANLQEIWAMKIELWSQILGGTPTAGVTEDKAGACEVPITRVVRKDVSGTTFVFKTYLKEIEKLATCSGTTWATYATVKENLKWPEPGQGTCKGTAVLVPVANGGGAVAEEVKKTEDTIGYANLADAREKYNDEPEHYHWLGVENASVASFYPLPGTSSGEPSLTGGESNCKKTHYTNVPTKIEADDNWSEVNGAHPEGNENYPICTLTYDVALMNYFLAQVYKTGSGKEEEEANLTGKTVYDYMNYVVAPGGGQADLAKHDYLEVEEAVGKYAQEEALIIAEGSDILIAITGKATQSFNTTENLPLILFTLEAEKFPPAVDITFTMDGGLKWTPALSLLSAAGGASGGLFNITKNECTKAGGYVPGETCLVEVEALAEGLEFLMSGNINLANLEVK